MPLLAGPSWPSTVGAVVAAAAGAAAGPGLPVCELLPGCGQLVPCSVQGVDFVVMFRRVRDVQLDRGGDDDASLRYGGNVPLQEGSDIGAGIEVK